ncbi:cystathione beta-lyase [Actinobaculum suis]|uniref:cysteine-S-conjugate beta-lyase n=2 Tax=Actinobaculum suis TaxID=1657 RepID=A0A1G7EQB1_9ACTO|nr:aminotransferase class I/II-fold pyridoxal phosphate-dependent enzyme [Actinobaculum suis]SDE65854.1 cystathione beta-lyase [Actinobaculum suis]
MENKILRELDSAGRYMHRFDETVDRWNTYSAKWDLMASSMGEQAISLSVADMEFRTAPAVQAAVEKAAAHGIYGYTEVFDDFRLAAAGWFARHHEWEFAPESVVFMPRVVELVAMIATTRGVQKTVTLSPAYDPILEVLEKQGVHISESLMLPPANSCEWRIDFADLERRLDGADLFILTNPHNPTGRAFTQKELENLAELLRKHNCLVISDDIHCDLLRQGAQYNPLAKVAPDLAATGRLITAVSPGKTFNMAGLEAAAIIVENADLRQELEAGKRAHGFHNPNYFAIPAAIAAWTETDAWLAGLRTYIDTNFAYAIGRINADHAGHWQAATPEATYLLWIHTGPELDTAEKMQVFQAATRVQVSAGSGFGTEWAAYTRLNLAVPRPMLEEAFDRFQQWHQNKATVYATRNLGKAAGGQQSQQTTNE